MGRRPTGGHLRSGWNLSTLLGGEWVPSGAMGFGCLFRVFVPCVYKLQLFDPVGLLFVVCFVIQMCEIGEFFWGDCFTGVFFVQSSRVIGILALFWQCKRQNCIQARNKADDLCDLLCLQALTSDFEVDIGSLQVHCFPTDPDERWLNKIESRR